MNVDTIYRWKEEVVTRRIAGETLLVPIRSRLADMQQIYALNPTAEYIWQQLDGNHTAAEIQADITARFAVETEQARIDIEEFIGQLLAADIIEEESDREAQP